MNWQADGDEIVVRFSRDDYNLLVFWLGCVGGHAYREHDLKTFWRIIGFVNRMNAGNPEFTPYEIPDQFKP